MADREPEQEQQQDKAPEPAPEQCADSPIETRSSLFSSNWFYLGFQLAADNPLKAFLLFWAFLNKVSRMQKTCRLPRQYGHMIHNFSKDIRLLSLLPNTWT